MFRMNDVLVAALLLTGAATVAAQTATGVPAAMPKAAARPWLGLGIACGPCSLYTEANKATWDFGAPPVIMEITPGGPAAVAGLAVGDTITGVNGIAIESPEGGRLFGRIRAGEPMRLSFARGTTSGIATVVPLAHPVIELAIDTSRMARAASEIDATRARLERAIAAERAGAVRPAQFSGTVAGADIEVRGKNVQVSSDQGAGTLVIKGDSITVTVKPAGGGRSQ